MKDKGNKADSRRKPGGGFAVDGRQVRKLDIEGHHNGPIHYFTKTTGWTAALCLAPLATSLEASGAALAF
jgi:hypothetical protein